MPIIIDKIIVAGIFVGSLYAIDQPTEPLTTSQTAKFDIIANLPPELQGEVGKNLESHHIVRYAFTCWSNWESAQRNLARGWAEDFFSPLDSRPPIELERVKASPSILSMLKWKMKFAPRFVKAKRGILIFGIEAKNILNVLASCGDIYNLTLELGEGEKNRAAIIDAIARYPKLEGLSTFSLSGWAMTDADIAKIAFSPHLSNLICLDLAGNHITEKGLNALLQSGSLSCLKKLILSRSRLNATAMHNLAQASISAILEYLDVSTNRIGYEGIRALINPDQFKSLDYLNVSHPYSSVDSTFQEIICIDGEEKWEETHKVLQLLEASKDRLATVTIEFSEGLEEQY